MDKLKKLQDKLGYFFRDEELLKNALIHRSYLGENNDISESNERMEFIGDGFLDAIIGSELYRMMPDKGEGVLSKSRASIVCEKSLANVAKELDLGSYIYMGRGEDMAGGREKDSVTADTVEAVIGAVFLDGGYDAASDLVLRIMSGTIEDAAAGKLFSDYKSLLQEKIQAMGPDKLDYRIARESGPDHSKTFFVELRFKGELIGKGEGKSKKEAEQNAAKDAYEKGKDNNVF